MLKSKSWVAKIKHLAPGIMLVVIALAIFSNLGIAVSMVIGSVLMVLTGCLTMDDAYDSITGGLSF